MSPSKHFKIMTALLFVAALGLVGGYKWLVSRIKAPPLSSAPSVLPKNDKEEVSFNEKTHTLTVQTATKKLVEYAKNPIVEIRKDGTAEVSRHVAGFENEPFIGFGYSDTGRVFIGDNLYHFGRFDLMGAIGWTPVASAVAFKAYGGIGYNVWHNTSVNFALNPAMIITKTPDIAGFVSVRF